MTSSLFIVVTTQKNRVDSAESLLLSTSKVLDFYEDSDGGTVFYYLERDGRRDKAIEYKCALNGAAFEALLRGAQNNMWVYIEVTEIYNELNEGLVQRYPNGQTFRVNIDHIAKGKNRDTRSSFLWIDRGAFELLRFKTSHTIEEIDDISSISFSISASGSL